MNSTTPPCGPRQRCRKWATCPTCARIRQARFADRAEAAARQMVLPTFYVLVPDDRTPAGIEYARRFFVRQTRPTAGVWSIESGAHRAGFHLNVISEWSELEGKFKGHIYREPIRTHVRAVAAYMTKAERAARKEEGFARQTGDLGRAVDWIKHSSNDAALPRAAAIAHDLDSHYLPPSAPGPERWEDTARRWLGVIYDTLNKGKT